MYFLSGDPRKQTNHGRKHSLLVGNSSRIGRLISKTSATPGANKLNLSYSWS